jgi:hypothetical protein
MINGPGRRGSEHGLRALRGWRPRQDLGRIDVRRGDRPYERVVGDDPTPSFRPRDLAQVAEPAGGSA